VEVGVDDKIRALLESIPDGFLALDEAGRCTYTNAQAERLTGRTRPELLGSELHTLLGEDAARHFAQALSDQPSAELEIRQEEDDRWLELRFSPLPEGGVAVYLRDVSARKRVERELQRSQEELRDFLDNASEGLHWVGPDGTILWANDAELRLLGYARDEYVGHSITEFHADRDVIDDILHRLTSGEELHSYEARLRCKDGSLRHVLINSNVRRREGEFINTRCFTRDITERKRVLEKLRASEQRFVRFMENLPGLAWMKDLEGRYRYVNAAAAEAFRQEPDALYGQTDAELFPPATAAQFRDHDARALRRAEGILVVETLEQADGVVHHSLVSKFPVTDPDGRLTGIGGIAIDVTERVQAEEALRAADRRKDEFLAMLAHELRNPLAPIITAVEIFRLRNIQDPVVLKQRDIIDRQVRQMKRLLDDLLDVSRITQGKVELQLEALDVRSVLQHAAETSRPLLDQRGHTLHVSVPETQLWVSGDLVRLCQVFTNLLNNAARYTPPGGTVWLTAEPETDQARIRVRDTGVGMTPEVLAQAFELFAQGQRGLDRAEGGLGLGLTLVRELVERHGGRVWAQSDGPGQGSELVVHLPLSAPPSE
jgi:PAS domain S-box-containing protein